jgi:hypothetical protein
VKPTELRTWSVGKRSSQEVMQAPQAKGTATILQDTVTIRGVGGTAITVNY